MLKGPSPYPSRPEHPRVKAVDETRTVIRVNFNSTAPKQRFCKEHKGGTVIQAIRSNSEAAEEFIRTFDQFEHFGERRMELAVFVSVQQSEKAALYFLSNLSDYLEYLSDEGLEKSLLGALKHKQASQYFLVNFHLFRDLCCFEMAFRAARGDKISSQPKLLLMRQEE